MPIDLNDAQPSRPQYDMDELSARLAAHASAWVPRYFPKGRISDDRSELRLANIAGDAPRKTGSCVIALMGEMAGSWHEFDGHGDGGGPLSTLKYGSGLDGLDLLHLAAELTGAERQQAASHRTNGGSRKPEPKPTRDPSAEISHILNRAVPLAGTLAETYLRARGLEDPCSPDLLFCDNVTDWSAGVGRPAMIGIARKADGSPTGGLHRTFLAYDGSAKATIEKPKKMLGAMEGGAVRLAPVSSGGRLGIAEGIETALAAMRLYGLPVWAATAANFMGGRDRTGRWIGFVPPPEAKEIYIFRDAGEAGGRVAEALAEELRAHGVSSAIIAPEGDDDFNADLMSGTKRRELPGISRIVSYETIGPDQPATPPEIISPATGAHALATAIGSLKHGAVHEEIEAVIAILARENMGPLAISQNLDAIRERTGSKLRDLQKTLAAKRRERPRTIGSSGGAEWVSRMILNDYGEPRAVMENAATAFESAPEFDGVLWFDEFANRPMMRRPPPWDKMNGSFVERAWGDADDAEATRWLQRAGIVAPLSIVHEALGAVASRSPYHPVREYLGELEWDREPRLNMWASDLLGSENTPYTQAVCARWLISAVARVMRPGVKVDHVLILEGPQGIYKSSVLRALFDPWFSDHPEEIGSKDASIQLAGLWCLEYADLDRFGRADRNRLKSFLSRQTDRYRPPFARYAADFPRQTVFAGTTNDNSYLDDPTGGRRFWPIKCVHPDPAATSLIRDQLWAEAFYRFNCGEKFYLAEESLQSEASTEQRARQHEEAWAPKIRYILQGGEFSVPLTEITVPKILDQLGIPPDRQNATSYNRIRDYLQFIGWSRKIGKSGDHIYLRPEA